MKLKSEIKTQIPFNSYKSVLIPLLEASPDFTRASTVQDVTSSNFSMVLELANTFPKKSIVSHNSDPKTQELLHFLQHNVVAPDAIKTRFDEQDEQKINHINDLMVLAQKATNLVNQNVTFNETVEAANPTTDFLIIKLNELQLDKETILACLKRLEARKVPFIMIYGTEFNSHYPSSTYFQPRSRMQAFDYWRVEDNKAIKITFYLSCQLNEKLHLNQWFDSTNAQLTEDLKCFIGRLKQEQEQIEDPQQSLQHKVAVVELSSALIWITQSKSTGMRPVPPSVQPPRPFFNASQKTALSDAAHRINKANENFLKQMNQGGDPRLFQAYKKDVLGSLEIMEKTLQTTPAPEEKPTLKRKNDDLNHSPPKKALSIAEMLNPPETPEIDHSTTASI